MKQTSLLYGHLPHLALVAAEPCILPEPQALLHGWLPQPPAASPQAELAALDMALACLYQHLEHYFVSNAFADRISAAAELLVAARQEEDDLHCQKLAAELVQALTAADAACAAALNLQAAEAEKPLT